MMCLHVTTRRWVTWATALEYLHTRTCSQWLWHWKQTFENVAVEKKSESRHVSTKWFEPISLCRFVRRWRRTLLYMAVINRDDRSRLQTANKISCLPNTNKSKRRDNIDNLWGNVGIILGMGNLWITVANSENYFFFFSFFCSFFFFFSLSFFFFFFLLFLPNLLLLLHIFLFSVIFFFLCFLFSSFSFLFSSHLLRLFLSFYPFFPFSSFWLLLHLVLLT